jgi:short-subunit dehydrogenase
MNRAQKADAAPVVTYLIVGGSSGLGRALAERFASAGHALALISSDARDTRALAADLSMRYEVPVVPVVVNLAAADLSFSMLDAALDDLPPLAGLLLPAGANSQGDSPGQPAGAFDALTAINYSGVCRLIDHYLPRLQSASPGLIVGFGSVAATRGRSRNAAYSAAKRALASYFESLRHALSQSNVIVQFYILGYLDTNLAFNQRTLLPRAAPERLANAVYQRRLSDFGTTYYPRLWYPVCLLLRMLPWFLFRRMSF